MRGSCEGNGGSYGCRWEGQRQRRRQPPSPPARPSRRRRGSRRRPARRRARPGQQREHVARVDAAAVEDRHPARHAPAPDREADQLVHLRRVVGGGVPAGADGPDRLVGEHQPRPVARRAPCRAAARAGGGSPARCGRPRARRASRPRRPAACSPALSAATVFRATCSSVSPNRWRRSEWPTRTTRAPASCTIGMEISPVNAPLGSQCTFCAPTRMSGRATHRLGARRRARPPAERTRGSGPATGAVSAEEALQRTPRAAAGPWFIFQLAA